MSAYSGAQYFVVRNTGYQLRPGNATRRSSYAAEAMKLPEPVRTMVSVTGEAVTSCQLMSIYVICMASLFMLCHICDMKYQTL